MCPPVSLFLSSYLPLKYAEVGKVTPSLSRILPLLAVLRSDAKTKRSRGPTDLVEHLPDRRPCGHFDLCRDVGSEDRVLGTREGDRVFRVQLHRARDNSCAQAVGRAQAAAGRHVGADVLGYISDNAVGCVCVCVVKCPRNCCTCFVVLNKHNGFYTRGGLLLTYSKCAVLVFTL